MNSLRLTIKSNPLYIAENPQNTKILHARYNMYTVLNRLYATHFLGQYLSIFTATVEYAARLWQCS